MINRTQDKNDGDMARTVRKAIDVYFKDLDGEKASGVYDMVINCVEKPLLESVLTRVLKDCTREEIYDMTVKNVVELYGLPFDLTGPQQSRTADLIEAQAARAPAA